MMKNNLLKLSLFGVFILCVNSSLYSQNFRANLTKVDSSGFYMVNIPLEVMEEVDDFSDFLLVNDRQEVVPYIVRDVDNVKHNHSFGNYKLDVSRVQNNTVILIDADKRPIDHFYLQVNNSQGVKRAFILGSNDSSNWFNVRDKVSLDPESETGTQALLKVEFPKSDYRQYKMVISDSLSAPLNVTSVKYRVTQTVRVDNLIETLVENINYDNSNSSLEQLSMSLSPNIHIEGINVYVSSPRFFNREVRVYKSKAPVKESPSRRNRRDRRRVSTPVYTLYNLNSSDGEVSRLYIDDKCDSLYLDIINGSNAPLSIDSITFTAIKHELVAYLEKGSYSLAYGGVTNQIRYDMAFVEHIPSAMPELEIVSINRASAQIEAHKEKSAFKIFIEKHAILIIIIIAMIAILSISYRLIRDKKQE